MNRRILIGSYGFPPWGGPTAKRAMMLTRYLPEFGWNPIVVCATADSPHVFDDPRAMSLVPENVPVYRVPFPRWHRLFNRIRGLAWMPRLVFRFPDAYQPWVRQCVHSVPIDQLGPVDVVFTTSPPHSIHIAGEHWARELSVPWVMDLRDAWIGNRMARWHTPLHKIAAQYFYREAVRTASCVVANTLGLAETIKHEFPECAERVVPIPNGYDEELFRDAAPRRPADSDPDTTVALYAGGTYGGWVTGILRKLSAIMESMQTQAFCPRVRLYVLGQLDPSESCEGAGPIGLGYASIVDVPAFLLGADVLVLCMPEAEAGSQRTLLKAYGYARAQRPVLYLGPRNATYDYLLARTSVRQYELSQLQDAARWIVSLTDEDLGTPLPVPASVQADSFEARARSLAQVLNHLV